MGRGYSGIKMPETLIEVDVMGEIDMQRMLDEGINNPMLGVEQISEGFSAAGEGIGGFFVFFIFMLLLLMMGGALIGGLYLILRKK